MKNVKLASLCLRIHASISLVFVGVIFTQSVVLAQEPDKVQRELFRDVAFAMEKARREEVPIYAPTLYKEALKFFRRAGEDYKKGERLGKIRKQINQALEAMNKAIETASVSRVELAELIAVRKQTTKREIIDLAPKEFAKAENYYKSAILKAESGDLRGARKKADQAMRGYREMFIIALLKGPIKDAEAQLKQAKATLSHKGYAKAKRNLEDLKKSVRNAKKQKFDIAKYAIEIGAEIDGIISLSSQSVFEAILPFSPIATKQPEKLTKSESTTQPVSSLLYQFQNLNEKIRESAIEELEKIGKNPSAKKKLNSELLYIMTQDPHFKRWVMKNRDNFPTWLNIPVKKPSACEYDLAITNLRVLKKSPKRESELKLEFTLSNVGLTPVFADNIYIHLTIITYVESEYLRSKSTHVKQRNRILSGVLAKNQCMKALSESGIGNIFSPAERNIIILSAPFKFSSNINQPKKLSSGQYRARVMAIVLEDQNYDKIKKSYENWYNMKILKELSGEIEIQNNYAFSEKFEVKY